jgi:hypothetical protein
MLIRANHPGEGQIIGQALRTERNRLTEWKKPGAAPDTGDIELYDYVADPLGRTSQSDPATVRLFRLLLCPAAFVQTRTTVAGTTLPRRRKKSRCKEN